MANMDRLDNRLGDVLRHLAMPMLLPASLQVADYMALFRRFKIGVSSGPLAGMQRQLRGTPEFREMEAGK